MQQYIFYWSLNQEAAHPGPPVYYNIRTTHHIAVITVLRSWRWENDCPKHIEPIQRSIKLLLLHLVGHLYYSSTKKIYLRIPFLWNVTPHHWVILHSCWTFHTLEMRPLCCLETLVITYPVVHRHFKIFKCEIYQNIENYYRYLHTWRRVLC